MRKIVLLIAILLMAVPLAACSGNTGNTSAPANALYFDNFSNTSSGWTKVQTMKG